MSSALRPRVMASARSCVRHLATAPRPTSTAAAQKTAASILHVGPKECFKHIILNELLKGMQQRYANGWTYIDFTPGPGSHIPLDDGLSVLYAHGRKKFDGKERNFFQRYIGKILEFNGETNVRKLKESPLLENAPSKYFSNAGLACMYLDELDKAIFIEEDSVKADLLRGNIAEHLLSRRAKVYGGSVSSNAMFAKAMLPPINRRGMVVFDLDEKMRNVKAAGTFKAQNYSTQDYYINETASMLGMMCKRWPTGTFFFPYPLTSPKPPINLFRHVAKSGVKQILNVSMFFEGDPEKRHSAKFAGSGIGALIVNPPMDLAHRLQKHMPALKTEVFQPEILLDDDEEGKLSETMVNFVLQAKQPWEDVDESTTLPNWEPIGKIEWTAEQRAIRDQSMKEDREATFEALLDMGEDDGMEGIYEDSKFIAEPEKLDPEYAREWQSKVTEQMFMQDPVRPTIVRVRKDKEEA